MNTEEVKIDSPGVKVTLRGLANKGNFFAQNFEKWQNLGHNLFAGDASECETRFADFLHTSLGIPIEGREGLEGADPLSQVFREQLDIVAEDINNHIEQFMPETMWDRVKIPFVPIQKGIEKNDLDPIKLIEKICELDKNKCVSISDFAILRALEMAAFYSYVVAKKGSCWQDEESDNDKAKRFMEWLDPDCTLTSRTIEIGLDPENRWKLASVRLPGLEKSSRKKGLYRIKQSVLCASFSKFFPRNEIRAIIQARHKMLFRAFAKRFRDPQSQIWPEILDMFGVRLIYNSDLEMKAGLEAVKLRAIWNNNAAVKYCRTSNKYSQTQMRIKNQRVLVNGQQHEIQHIRAEDWLNILHSVAPESHARYHLRWFTDANGIFMHAFPPDLYRIDWTSPEIQRNLCHHVKSKVIAWNLNLAEGH